MTLSELDPYAAPEDLPSLHVRVGDVGTVVAVLHPDHPTVVIVEFCEADGTTKGLATFNADTGTLLGIDAFPVSAHP